MSVPESPDGELRAKDREALERFEGLRETHGYTAHWFNNATFVFPVLAAIAAAIVWAATGSLEAGGAAIFFLIVTIAMLPIVYLTWQRTTTAIVLHAAGVSALHQGTETQTLEWESISAVRRVETMGNVRWYIVGPDEDHIVVEGEIADVEGLLASVREGAGLGEEPER